MLQSHNSKTWRVVINQFTLLESAYQCQCRTLEISSVAYKKFFVDQCILTYSKLLSKWRKPQNKVKDFIVKLLKFTKDVDIVLFKETLNTSKDFKTLNVRRRGHSRNLLQLPVSYQGPIPISCQKKKKCLELLPLVPNIFHSFYTALPTTSTVRDIHPDTFKEVDEDLWFW